MPKHTVSDLLVSRSCSAAFTHDQCVIALQTLNTMFPGTEDYNFKVLLPEALIKICENFYGCTNEEASEYLTTYYFKGDFKSFKKSKK